MRRLLLATCMLILASCTREFDPSLRDEGVERADKALAVCDEHRPDDAGGPNLLLATPTTAGDITDDARTDRREPIHPWDTLPSGHFVASCNFGTTPEDPVTTWLIDESGRTTRDRSPSAGL